VLAAAGFYLWDLGGTDQSAMMSYKYDIAETFLRPSFFDKFRSIRAANTKVESILTGILVPKVSEADLAELPES